MSQPNFSSLGVYRKVTQQELKKLLDEDYNMHDIDLEFHLEFVKGYYLSKIKKGYNYFVTATLKDTKDAELAEKWIKDRIKLSFINGIILVKEHENSNLHFHYIMSTEKAVTKNQTQKHYMSRFGHVDFKPLKSTNDYQQVLDYISKENSPEIISK